jgi:hypothetical protein
MEKLGTCRHDVEATFRGSGSYSEEFLRKQLLTWHPDKFIGRDNIQELAGELFKIIQELKYGPDN